MKEEIIKKLGNLFATRSLRYFESEEKWIGQKINRYDDFDNTRLGKDEYISIARNIVDMAINVNSTTDDCHSVKTLIALICDAEKEMRNI